MIEFQRRMHTLFKSLILCLALCVPSLAHAGGNWSLTDTSGKSVRLSDFRGKWVLVNFWATWCPPCLAEIPDLESLYREGRLTVIGVAMSYRRSAEISDFIGKNGITYPVILGDEDVAEQFGEPDSLPTSFLYSPTGQLVGQHEGPLSAKEIMAAMHGSPFANQD